jgi:hypothetical protein
MKSPRLHHLPSIRTTQPTRTLPNAMSLLPRTLAYEQSQRKTRDVLSFLRTSVYSTESLLGQVMHIKHRSTVHNTLVRLEQAGLIRRVESACDSINACNTGSPKHFLHTAKPSAGLVEVKPESSTSPIGGPPNNSGGTPPCIKQLLAILGYIAGESIMTIFITRSQQESETDE